MQAFVDSQFYGLELLPMHAASDVESARKLFVCTCCFEVPPSTLRNLTYALFPAMFTLIKRHAVFFKRATGHDIDCVRKPFFFFTCANFIRMTSPGPFSCVKCLKPLVSTFPTMSLLSHVSSTNFLTPCATQILSILCSSRTLTTRRFLFSVLCPVLMLRSRLGNFYPAAQ
jgi:hypothetical protein